METEVYAAFIGAFIGGIIPLIGLFVTYQLDRKKLAEERQENYKLDRKKEEASRQHEAALRHIERQMEELYGPLWGLLQQSKYAYEILAQRRKVYGLDYEAEDYLKDYYFMPINKEIFDLLKKKSYLIDSTDLPDSFQEFMKHKTTLEILYSLWKEKGKESSKIKGTGWPTKFDEDVVASLNRLRHQYQNYLLQGEILEEIKKKPDESYSIKSTIQDIATDQP